MKVTFVSESGDSFLGPFSILRKHITNGVNHPLYFSYIPEVG
jgi:hypothetical protein